MLLNWLLLILAGCCQSTYQYEQQVSFKRAKLLHKPSHFNHSQIYKLASLTDINHMNEVLDNILVVRVVGTPSHEKVKKYIKSSLHNLGWAIETDKFEDNTPIFGKLPFENIIAKLNPNAKRFLVLACHYDSKYEKNFDFFGATDSAVPCMQLINLAKVMEKQLNTIKNNDLSLMLLFFDGEEAFKEWGPKDSIYGARNLAAKWHKTKFTYQNEDNLTYLDKIDILVLLDLIGASNPNFYNYFTDTSKHYSLLSSIENSLANLKVFQNYPYGRPQNKYFQDYLVPANIEDDHIPFLQKGVRILHLIPYPFPAFWHRAEDNRSNINMKTIENINKILRVFVASYLNMKVQEDLQSMEHLEL